MHDLSTFAHDLKIMETTRTGVYHKFDFSSALRILRKKFVLTAALDQKSALGDEGH